MRINLEKILLEKKFTETEQNPAIEEARSILKKSDEQEIEILERIGLFRMITSIKIQEKLSAMLGKKVVDIQDIRRVLLPVSSKDDPRETIYRQHLPSSGNSIVRIGVHFEKTVRKKSVIHYNQI